MYELKMKHLEMIQGIINRMASNSFLLKGWSVTLVTAVLVFSTNVDEKLLLLYAACIPVFFFWGLDGYFLYQERLFRALYQHVAGMNENSIDFQMNHYAFKKKSKPINTLLPNHEYDKQKNIKQRKEKSRSWIASVFSVTLIVFYFAQLIVIVFLAFCLKMI